MKRGTAGSGGILPLALLGFLAVAGIHCADLVRNTDMVAHRVLRDTDSYMWLNRATEIRRTGDWLEHTYYRTNPPVGHEQHWTRPTDGLLLAGGRALEGLIGFDQGLYVWSLLLTPLLHLATLFTLLWAALPLLRDGASRNRGLGMLVLVFLSQLAIYQVFLLGRPDHHAILALLFSAFIGFWLRVLLDDDQRARNSVCLGLVAALAIWVSIESLLFVVMGMLGLGLAWLVGVHGIHRKSAIFGASLLLGSVLALLAERGFEGFAQRATDTLSLSHIYLLAGVSAFWTWIWAVERGMPAITRRQRLAVGVAGVAVVLLVVAIGAPELMRSPLADVDELYRVHRLNRIRELQPLWEIGDTPMRRTAGILLFAGIAFPAVGYTAYRTVRSRGVLDGIIWLVWFLGLVAYLLLAFRQRRWTAYVVLAAVIPYAMLAVEVRNAVFRAAGEKVRLPVTAMSSLILVIWPLTFAPFVYSGNGTANGLADTSSSPARWGATPDSVVDLSRMGGASGWRETCDLIGASRVLTDTSWFPEGLLLLAAADNGPQLLYRTPHSVLSIPNHRHQPGYTFSRSVMMQEDPTKAASMLVDRGVGALLVCVDDVGVGFAHDPEMGPRFVDWLAAGGIPQGYRLLASTGAHRIFRRDSAAPDSSENHRPRQGKLQ